MNVVQTRQVEGLANDVRLALGQVERAAVVRLAHALLKLLGDIVIVVLGGPDRDGPTALVPGRLVGVLVAELEQIPRHARRQSHGLNGSGGRGSDERESLSEAHGDDLCEELVPSEIGSALTWTDSRPCLADLCLLYCRTSSSLPDHAPRTPKTLRDTKTSILPARSLGSLIFHDSPPVMVASAPYRTWRPIDHAADRPSYQVINKSGDQLPGR